MKKTRKRFKVQPFSCFGKLVVLLYFLALTVPLSFAIVTSLKTEQERLVNPIGFPKDLTLANFAEALEVGNLLNAFKNSLVIAGCSVFINLIFCIIVSYALNRIRGYKVGQFLYMFILFEMFIPSVGTATGLMLRRQLGLYNNLHGEIIAGAFGLSMTVFMISSFLRTFPAELEEAAILDGASDTVICFNIVTPLIKPIIVSMAILNFKDKWNNALGPMLTLRDEKLYTLPMTLLLKFTKGTTIVYTTMFAGVIIAAIPVVVLYCMCQKQFTNALAGSLKG